MSYLSRQVTEVHPRASAGYESRATAELQQRPAILMEARPTTEPEPRTASFTHRGTTYASRVIYVPSRSALKKFAEIQIIKTASYTATPTENEPKKKLALLLPGHNEELIIAETIRSAMAAGQEKRDIFVVDDNSSDDTRKLAVEMLGEQNVLSVERSGKALAVKKAVDHFGILDKYTWLHIADADSVFSSNYFREYRSKLDDTKYAVAVGFVQSMRGNWISTYRSLTYTFSQHVSRRIQSKLNMISVFPGPITCFRTDIFPRLELDGTSLTEDFDITLQVHRKRLGKIVYIPKAINYTQDPQTLSDFYKQNLRWQRGFFQGVRKYRIGLRGQTIDVSLGLQMSQMILFILQLTILLPLIIYITGNWMIIPVAIAADFIINCGIAILASIAVRRWYLLGAMPAFYFLRWVEIGAYLIAFFEVMVLGRFREEVRGWSTEGRRYELSTAALREVK